MKTTAYFEKPGGVWQAGLQVPFGDEHDHPLLVVALKAKIECLLRYPTPFDPHELPQTL